jgi:hypothetical protein
VVIEAQLRCLASWLSPAGRLVMRANPGLPMGSGLEFFAWSVDNVDPIGAAVGLRRDGPIHYDTHRTNHGTDDACLVWCYRPDTAAPGTPAGQR